MKTQSRVTRIGMLGILMMMLSWTAYAAPEQNTSWGVTIYPCKQVLADASKQLTIAGIDLATYGYTTIHQYVLDDNRLFVLGTKINPADSKRRDTIPILSVISRQDLQEIVIAEYDTNLSYFLMHTPWMVFFLNNLPSSLPFILIEYRDGNVARTGEETTTYLEVFRVDAEHGTLLQCEPLTTLDIGYSFADQEGPYRYMGGTEDARVQTDMMRYLLTDANGDGYADILIWKGHYVVMEKTDPRQGDFFFDHEELYVMYFDPKAQTFSSITPLDDIRVKYLDEIKY